MSKPVIEASSADTYLLPEIRPSARGAAGSKQERPVVLWTGRVLSSVFALFMLGASVAPKVLHMPVAEASMVALGWPADYTFWIGILELACVVLYLVPRTSALGAILSTGLLGGAMATQIRAENPLFSHILFSMYVGVFMWGGLILRRPRLRELLSLGAGTELKGTANS